MSGITETRRHRAAILYVSVALWFLPIRAFAQTPPPDLSGFWNNQYTPNLAQALGHEPPYTPYGLERWKNVDTQNDPTGRCLPVGPSRAFTAPMPFQIVQSPKMIAFLYEYQTIYRLITRTFTRGKQTDRVMAYSCEENNKDVEHLRS